MMPNKIGAIGNGDILTAFRAVGVEVFDCRNPHVARTLITKLAGEGYAVLFLTEELCRELQDFLQEYKAVAYPAVLPIPSAEGATGYTMRGIKEDMERAIGADILFNKD